MRQCELKKGVGPIVALNGGAIMIRYRDVLKESKGKGYHAPEWARKKIYDYALRHGKKAAVREFGCSKTTVAKIVREGWQLQSRARKNQPGKISKSLENEILRCRQDKGMGKNNIPKQYELSVSSSTVGRVLSRRADDLPKSFRIKARKRKWRQTKDLREIKQRYKPFESCCIDAKDLWDIPVFYPYLKALMIPKVQLTFTCQRTGATFISYASGETTINLCAFVVYVFEHLKRHGIEVKTIRLRHDGGSAFIGNAHSFKESLFRKLVRDIYQAKPRRIKHKNQNSEVERYHGLIEQYFYTIQKFESRDDFFKKAAETQAWFNYVRKNSYKNWKTPLEILREASPGMDPHVLALPPIDMDRYQDMYFYKKDPDYKPLTKEMFFQNTEPWMVENLESTAFRKEIEFWVGWPTQNPASGWARPA